MPAPHVPALHEAGMQAPTGSPHRQIWPGAHSESRVHPYLQLHPQPSVWQMPNKPASQALFDVHPFGADASAHGLGGGGAVGPRKPGRPRNALVRPL